jgi:hypothetical protein
MRSAVAGAGARAGAVAVAALHCTALHCTVIMSYLQRQRAVLHRVDRIDGYLAVRVQLRWVQQPKLEPRVEDAGEGSVDQGSVGEIELDSLCIV